jgi:AcrR family transcriptional regulator
MVKKKKKAGEVRLSRAEWLEAALDAMASQGTAGLSVEALARTLGVTKGSFYWHFADRQALLEAALEHWEERSTERLIAELSEIADPRERLAKLIGTVSAGGRADRVHLALAGDRDVLVRTTLARISRRRLELLEAWYAELGQGPEAKQSALLAYATYVGLVHLRIEAPNALPKAAAFRAYVEYLIEKLVPHRT